jgi:hypothetical protein
MGKSVGSDNNTNTEERSSQLLRGGSLKSLGDVCWPFTLIILRHCAMGIVTDKVYIVTDKVYIVTDRVYIVTDRVYIVTDRVYMDR